MLVALSVILDALPICLRAESSLGRKTKGKKKPEVTIYFPFLLKIHQYLTKKSSSSKFKAQVAFFVSKQFKAQGEQV